MGLDYKPQITSLVHGRLAQDINLGLSRLLVAMNIPALLSTVSG